MLDEFKKKIARENKSNNNHQKENEQLIDDLNIKFDYLLKKNAILSNKLNTTEKILNEHNAHNEHLIQDLNNKIINLNQEVGNLLEKNNTLSNKLNLSEKILDSYQELFKTIYLNHEIKPKGVLEKIQILGRELLTFLDNVCKKHDLEYWLDYGTLIGSIRHGTYIPWDDDLDVGMMREDYKKLYPILQEEIKNYNLDNDIILTNSNRTSPTMILPFYQFIYHNKSFNHTMVHIDIFPYDYLTSKENITSEAYSKVRYDFYLSLHNGKSIDDAIDVVYDSFKLTYESTDLILPGVEGVLGSTYALKIFETDEIFPLNTVEFMGRNYCCPNDYDKYLKKIYGNYMNIPKIVKTHGLVNIVKSKNNILKIYDDAIYKMKNANESYDL